MYGIMFWGGDGKSVKIFRATKKGYSTNYWSK
jgi:hypothetical protein